MTTNTPQSTTLDKQMKLLIDMRQRFNLPIEDTFKMSKRERSMEIERLMSLPLPPSPAQLEKIEQLMSDMRGAGANINISQEKLDALTGGRDGTASKLITFLNDKLRELSPNLAPTDNQLDILVKWYGCPDIPWEAVSTDVVVEPAQLYANGDIAVPEKTMSETISINFKKDNGDGTWTRMTPDEFREELRAKLTRATTSRFIDAHQQVYYEWKKSRAVKNQINQIQTLEKRIANSLNGVKEQVFAMDETGEIIGMTDARPSHDMTVNAYDPTPEYILEQLSTEEASDLISHLQYELSLRHGGSEANDDSQLWLDEKVQNFKTLISASPEQMLMHYAEKKAKEVNDALYAFSAGMGRDFTHITEFQNLDIAVRGGNTELLDNLKEALLHEMLDCMQYDNRDIAWSTMGRIAGFFDEIPVLEDVQVKFIVQASELLKDIDRGALRRREG